MSDGILSQFKFSLFDIYALMYIYIYRTFQPEPAEP
jgi:hypothetical protein